jgi:glucose-1-phosphate thymidylyltransferase
MRLIIPMAGRGTRVRPHSHVTPKPLLPVCGKSMVERIVETFAAVLPRPLTEGVFVLGPDFGQDVRDQLEEICGRFGMNARFAVQDRALGTAHAVACAGDALEGEGIVVFADTLFFMDPGVDLDDADVVAWVKHVEDPSRFGVAVREGDRIIEFVEKPKELISNEALIGIYYVRRLQDLRKAIDYLFKNELTGHGDEYQLTDAFDRLLKQDAVFKTAGVTEWLDCGTIPALTSTTRVILDHEKHDVEVGRAGSCVIHPPVYLGPGAVIENSVVGPHVSVEAGARISGSVVSRTIVFGSARVRNSALDESIVGAHADVNRTSGRLNIGDHSTVNA